MCVFRRRFRHQLDTQCIIGKTIGVIENTNLIWDPNITEQWLGSCNSVLRYIIYESPFIRYYMDYHITSNNWIVENGFRSGELGLKIPGILS